jgi:hypothetical protein
VYLGDSLIGFSPKEEEILIQKMIYKEIYREDVLMWMDLWEKERKQSTYLAEALVSSNNKLLRQEALNEKNERLRAHCEKNYTNAVNYTTSLEKEKKFWKNTATVAIPVSLLLGYFIAK